MREELIEMFNDDTYDFSKTENAEKLVEAFNKMYSKNVAWKIARAKEDHECVRKCKINKGDVHAKYEIEKDKTIRLCPKCLAMVLFFNEAHKHTSIMPEW